MLCFVLDYFHFSSNFSAILGLDSFISLAFPLILLLNLQGKVFPSINIILFYLKIIQTQLNTLLLFAQ